MLYRETNEQRNLFDKFLGIIGVLAPIMAIIAIVLALMSLLVKSNAATECDCNVVPQVKPVVEVQEIEQRHRIPGEKLVEVESDPKDDHLDDEIRSLLQLDQMPWLCGTDDFDLGLGH